MATYTVSTKIIWAERGLDVDPAFNQIRNDKIDEMILAGKTDGLYYHEIDLDYLGKLCVERDFIDQESADEFLTFVKDMLASFDESYRIIDTKTFPTPERPTKP